MNNSNQESIKVDRARWPAWVHTIERVLKRDEHRRERRHGAAAMSPGLTYGRHFGPPLPDAAHAAVLILMVLPEESSGSEVQTLDLRVLLTVRAKHLKSHPGQVSFPGGRKEIDESLEDAALREFEEELGIVADSQLLLGEMTPLFVYASNHYVQPFLGVTHHLPAVRPNLAEVESVIQFPMRMLFDSPAVPKATYTRGLASWQAPTLHVEETQVWGATAMMLGELATLLGLARDS